MARLGIIGSGSIGAALARLAVAAGHEVVIANSRGPGTLAGLVEEIGDGIRAGTAQDAAVTGELTVLAVPLDAYRDLPRELLEGRTVLSTGNYYPHRDGRITELDALELNTAEHEKRLLPGAVIVKAFNNIVAHHIPALARPAGARDRSGMAVFGDDVDAKAAVSAVVSDWGFDPLDAGPLAESWRTEPESGVYTPIYAEDREAFRTDYLADGGAAVPASRLRDLVDASFRADVAGRAF